MKTEAEVLDVAHIFDEQFYVPAYQRRYQWGVNDAVQLLQDVRESCDAGEAEYFIGSVICIERDGGYEIVDGQQRLITLTIILSCLSESIENFDIKKGLRGLVLRSRMFSGDSASRAALKVHDDKEHDFYLEHVLKGHRDMQARSSTEKLYEQNCKEIGEYLKDMGQSDLERLAEHLFNNVSVVFVTVGDPDSAFRLFNVLNNRGMRLKDADLVKNLLLEAAAGDAEGTRLVKNSWKVMEDKVGERDLHHFIRMHIISEKENRDRVIKIANKSVSPYDYYRHQLKHEFGGKSTEMVKVLKTSATNYRDILDGKWGAGKTIRLLNNLKPFEWMPAFLAFANKWPGQDGFVDFAQMFEKIYMQSWFTTGKRDDACYTAIEAINTGKPVDAVIGVLKERAEDKRFEEALDSSEFYDVTRRQIINLVKAVLIRINDEQLDDSAEVVPRKVTVEHILPQKRAGDYWRKRFTPAKHAEWVNKLGNLTLLSGRKNSAARNSGFPEKKKAYEKDGKISPFAITQEILGYEEWNADSLRARHEQLKERVLALWSVRDKTELFDK